MKKRNVAKQILRLLVTEGHLTLGDIARRLRLHAGTAIHQRMTDLRKRHGKDAIVCYRDTTGRYRYFIDPKRKAALRQIAEAA
jgi:predicted ArsR family transcriptional regulator